MVSRLMHLFSLMFQSVSCLYPIHAVSSTIVRSASKRRRLSRRPTLSFFFAVPALEAGSDPLADLLKAASLARSPLLPPPLRPRSHVARSTADTVACAGRFGEEEEFFSMLERRRNAAGS